AGPGLNEVRLLTSTGPIRLYRPNGGLALLTLEDQPDRAVALKRRETSELLAEELRRLDPDDTYASALRFGVDRLGGTGALGGSASALTAATAGATSTAATTAAADAPRAASAPVSGYEPGSAVAPSSSPARPSGLALPPAAPSASEASAGSAGSAGDDDSERPTPAQMPPVKKAAAP
ncbi:OpcA/G6PD domain-containing protein, partial [Streptomyces scabiei]